MEQFIVYAIVAVGFIIFRILTNSKKNQPKRVPQKKDIHKRSITADERQRQIFKQLGLEELLDPPSQQKQQQRPQSQTKPQARTMKEERAFLKRELQQSAESHFSEDDLIRRMEAAKKQGREIQHHTHQYVDQTEYRIPEEAEDRQRALQQAKFEQSQKEAYAKKRKRGSANAELRKMFRSKKNLRNGIIFKELLDRKHF